MKQYKKIIIFERPHELSIYLLKQWMRMAEQALQERKRFCAALQGGEALKDFFSKLSGVNDYAFWDKIHIFQTDQFHALNDNLKHQFQFLKNNLLDYINIPDSNVHAIVTHTENPAHSADQYEEDLIRFFDLTLNDIPKFDCVIMGLDETSRFKSVFQRGANIPVKAIVDQYSVQDLKLVSVHPDILAQARHIIFVGSGEHASMNVSQMIEVWGKDWPTTKNDSNFDQSLVFLLDGAAAHQLSTNYDHVLSGEGVMLFDKTST